MVQQRQDNSTNAAPTRTLRARVGSWAITWIGAISLVASLVTVISTGSGQANAAGPAPAMFGYVPLPSDDFQDAFEAINPAANDTLDFTVGITVASQGAVVYYDHWEDGYEADVTDPQQATTQVWGDGDITNGDASTVCSTCPGDLLTAGDVFVLRNSITTSPRNPAEIRWDGRDAVASTRGFAMTAGGWTTPLGSVLAGVISAFDTSRYGTAFLAPVGQNTPVPAGATPPFEYTGASIMAAQAGTTVQVDKDNNGSFETTGAIGVGEAMFVNGGILEGARIIANKPVQVHLMTGDVGATYEAHFFTLVPTPLLSSNYINPVASTVANLETIVYLFNPNASAITVTPTCTSCAGTINVPAGQSASFTVPSGEAVQFSSGGPTFTAVGAMGSQSGSGGGTDNSSVYDWGYTLVPANILTTQVVLGWAPGASDVPPSNATFDPVWVTTLSATTLSVDFDADPTTGALSGDCVGQHDLEISVGALEATRITDSGDNSMTGARVYTCDGTAVAAAWGEDPSTAPTGSPGLDAGYTVIPTSTILVNKTSSLAIDTSGDGKLGPGDTIEYSLMVSNAGGIEFTNVVVDDNLVAELDYVPSSTVLDDGTTITPVADDFSPPAATPFPLDEAGLGVPNVPAGETLFVRFRAVIESPWTAPATSVSNTMNVTTDQGTGTSTDTQQLAIADLSLSKTETASPQFVGQDAVFQIVVSNGGPDTAPDVEVTDLLPPDLAYQSHSATQGTYVPGTGVWTVGDINSGANATLTLTARVDDTSAVNSAEVTASAASDPDSTPANDVPSEDDQDSATVNVSPLADLSLTKARTLGPDVSGNTTYRITVTNDGPSDATGIEVTEIPPSGATFVGATQSQGGFDSGTNVWTVGAVNAGASATLDVTYTVPSFPTSNFAEITAADQADPDSQPAEDPFGPDDPPNQDDEASVTVTLSADLSLSKTVTTDPSFVGDNAVFELTITNDGPDPASSVVVTDVLPAGLSHVSHNASSGTYTPGTGAWALDPMASGTSETLEITARVTAPGAITNDAEVTASGAPDPDSTPDNNNPAEDDQDSAGISTTGASLGDTVFFDADADGTQDAGEPGIAGVDVTVIDPGPNGTLGDGDDVTLPTVTTGANGQWTVSGLGPATYRVNVDNTTLPAGITDPTGDPDGVGSAHTADVAVSAGQTRTDVDFGYTGTGTIGDTLFLDYDGSGTPDPGEGIEGVDVQLTWAGFDDTLGTSDDIVYNATTDASGVWSVTDLAPGTYEVDVDETTLPPGVHNSSDPDGGNDGTSIVVLSAGATDMNQDFGYLGAGVVGHLVFRDDNDNGTGDSGEGLSDAQVEVHWAGADGTWGGGDDHTYEVATDGGGDYGVGNLPAGSFRVQVLTSSLPSGAANTVDPDGGNDSTSELALATSESNLEQNFGYSVPADAVPVPSSGGSLALTGATIAGRLALSGISAAVTGFGLILVSQPVFWVRFRRRVLRKAA